MKIDKPIIFFDGICNLCNYSISIVLKYKDIKKDFFIASIQGQTAKNLLPLHYIDSPSSIIFFDGNGEIFQKSSALLRIVDFLIIPWCWLKFFKIFPAIYLDKGYDFIATRRYKFWGKRPSCRLPTENERHFFLP